MANVLVKSRLKFAAFCAGLMPLAFLSALVLGIGPCSASMAGFLMLAATFLLGLAAAIALLLAAVYALQARWRAYAALRP